MLNQRYTIQKTIGKGSFGETYLAKDTQTGEACAIKKLFLDKAQDWKSLELFEREASTLKELNHPNIPNFVDYFTSQDEGLPEMYLVQEYIEGENIESLVEKGKRFQYEDLKNVTVQMAEVLVYLHGFSPPIIHRDIKPSNILLTADDQVHLIDFGAVYSPINTKGSTIVGTFGYMPLEQFEGRVSPASDIYALGASVLFMATGKAPNQWPKKGLAYDLSELNLPSSFKKVLGKMLAPDTAQRYGSAREILNDLHKSPLALPDFKNKRGALIGAGVGILVLPLVLYGVLSRPASQDKPMTSPPKKVATAKGSSKKMLVNVQGAPPWKLLKPDSNHSAHPKRVFFDKNGDIWTMETSYIRRYQAPNYHQLEEWSTSHTPGKDYFKDLVSTSFGVFALKGNALLSYQNNTWKAIPLNLTRNHIYDITVFQNKLLLLMNTQILEWSPEQEDFKLFASFDEKLSYPDFFQNQEALWIRSGNNIWKYDNSKLQKVFRVNYSQYNLIKHAHLSGKGEILMGSQYNLLKFQPQTQKLSSLSNLGYAQSFHNLNAKQTLIGSKYSGLRLYEGSSLFPMDWRRGFFADQINDITESPTGLLAFATDEGLVLADKTKTIEHIKSYPKVRFLPGKWTGLKCLKAAANLKGNHPDIQVGTLSGENHIFLNGELGCPDEIGYARSPQEFVVEDRKGLTHSTLYYKHNGQIKKLSPPTQAEQLYLDKNGDIYLSTRYDYKTKQADVYHYRPAQENWTLIFDGAQYELTRSPVIAKDGETLWVGSHSYKYKNFPLFKIQNGKTTPVNWPYSGWSSPRILAMTPLGQGNLAIATYEGIYLRMNGDLTLVEDKKLRYSIKKMVLRDDLLWISYGNSARGLSTYNLKTGELSHITSRQGLWMDHIENFGFTPNQIWMKSVHESLAYHDLEPLLKSMVRDTLALKEKN